MADVAAVVAEVQVVVQVEEEVEVAAAFELPTRCLWERGIASTSDWS